MKTKVPSHLPQLFVSNCTEWNTLFFTSPLRTLLTKGWKRTGRGMRAWRQSLRDTVRRRCILGWNRIDRERERERETSVRVGAPWKLTYPAGRWPGGKESGTKQTVLGVNARRPWEITDACVRAERSRKRGTSARGGWNYAQREVERRWDEERDDESVSFLLLTVDACARARKLGKIDGVESLGAQLRLFLRSRYTWIVIIFAGIYFWIFKDFRFV